MKRLLVIVFCFCCFGAAGCQQGILAKRRSESCCPTDIRQMHTWVFGEDAIFWTPCGVDETYYGHRATDWRDWPSDAASWRAASGVAAPMSQVGACEGSWAEPVMPNAGSSLPAPTQE